MAIQIGDKVPEVLGLDQNGTEIKLSDQRLYGGSVQPAGRLQ